MNKIIIAAIGGALTATTLVGCVSVKAASSTDRAVCSKISAAYQQIRHEASPDPMGEAYLTVLDEYEKSGMSSAAAGDLIDRSISAHCPQLEYLTR